MKNRDFVIILGSLLFLTILWVSFTIYHNLTTSTIKDPLTIQIIPISGKFDIKTLNDLKNRQQVSPDYEFKASTSQKTATSSSEEAVSPTPEEPSPTIEEASSSGDLLLEEQ